jgi:hypothetical protein
MKPGTLVAYVSGFNQAYLGRLVQPVVAFGERRWTVEWLDEYEDRAVQTYSEKDLLKVVPQRV